MDAPPAAPGAMSPEPVTVKVPPARRYPDSDPVVYVELLPPLTKVPRHPVPGRPPVRLTWSKMAVASVGLLVPDPPEICWLTCLA